MKNLIVLFVVIFISCSNSSSNQISNEVAIKKEQIDSLKYSNKEYKMVIYFEKNIINHFKLYSTKTNIEISEKSELVTVDGELPQGTNRIDYNNPNDIKGFECDSTYQFINDKISIAFAIEKVTKKRLDLSIYNSINKNFKDGDYTLLKEN